MKKLLHAEISRKRFVFIFTLLVCLIFAAGPGIFAADDAPRISIENEPHIGEQVILSAQTARMPNNASLGWSVAPTTGKNPVRISLRSGGREFAFTPIDTEPIQVNAYIEDSNGNIISTSEITIVPKEFNVNISTVIDKPLTLWDAAKRVNYSLSPDVLLADSPVRIKAEIKPEFHGDHSFQWNADASTAILSPDNEGIFIKRSQIGDSVVTVTAFNSAGIKLGSGTQTIKITLPTYVYQNAAKERNAWTTWQNAQELWESKNYSEAVQAATNALKLSPRDPEISNGLKVMMADFERFNRASKLREEAAGLISQRKFDDALQRLRSAQVIWPLDDGATSIRNAEQNAEKQRQLIQQATWLKDTASAYDNERLYEDALDYYAKSLEIYKLEGVAERIESIKTRLSRIASADRYAGEGNRLEREGKLQEAFNMYNASAQLNSDAALTQHIKELASIVQRRERQAKTLFNEARQRQSKNQNQEALKLYRESLLLNPTDDAATRVRQLERTIRLPQGTVLRTPEDFGIGTKADALKFVQEGDELYNQGKLEEAAVKYRRAQSISSSPEIQSWLENIEANIRERRSVQAANELITRANQLYNQGKTKEAIELYRQSLTTHANPQIEAFLKNQGK